MRLLGRRHRRTVLDTGAETSPRTFVERPVAHDVVGDTRVHGEHGLLDRAARGAAAVVDAGEERQLTDAEVAGDLDLGIGVLGVGDHTVDLGRVEAGVGDRRVARLDRQA